jgi:hypothetical protein
MQFFYLFGCREMITHREYMSHSLRKCWLVPKPAVSNYSKELPIRSPQARQCPLWVIRVRVRLAAAPTMSVMPRKRRSATKMCSRCELSTGRLQVARKPRHLDEWDPYVPPYDPYGPGAHVIDYAGDQFADD